MHVALLIWLSLLGFYSYLSLTLYCNLVICNTPISRQLTALLILLILAILGGLP